MKKRTNNLSVSDLKRKYKKDNNIENLFSEFEKLLNEKDNELKESLSENIKKDKRLSHQAKLAGIGEMAAQLSHEINNPLMGITLISEHIKLLNKDNDKLLKYCKEINFNIDRISDIVAKLKKISNESESVPTKIHSLNTLVSKVERKLKESFKKKEIKYNKIDISKEILVNVQDLQVEQVLMNLLTNSIHAIEDLEKSEKWIKLKFFKEKENINIEIKNGGNQIPQKIQGKIFDPFFTTKQIGEGTGLGLQICKKILESYGGDIKLNPNEENPTFIMSIPIVKD